MTSVLARLLRATIVLDKAYRTFDGARRELVLALASDRFLETYSDVCYAATETYRPRSTRFRSGLFTWELAAFERWFPPPPARVLVGAAGGGREAVALAAQGYAVVAFEPSALAGELAVARQPGQSLEVYRARYADLPRLKTMDGTIVDVARVAFDAGVIGWGSFSHLPSDRDRIDVMRAYATLVDGPVLVSFLGRPDGGSPPAPTGLRRLLLRFVGERRPGTTFWVDVGTCRRVSPAEMRGFADAADVDLLYLDAASEWPNAVFARRGALAPATAGDQAETP